MALYNKFLHRPAYIVIAAMILTFAGVWAWFRMPVDFFPGLNYPLLNVITQVPGVSPQDVELLVSRPIESEVQSIRGVRRTSSISASGVSQVTVEFGQGYDLLAARQLVSAAISRLEGKLPPGANPLIDNLGSRLQQVLGYTIVSKGLSETQLRQVVQFRMVSALQSLPGISRIDVMGGKRAAFVVEPDINQLRHLDLSLADLQAILAANNVNASGRYLSENHLDVPIRAQGQVRRLDDLRFMLVKLQPDGQPIFLKDVAQVHEGHLPEHYLISSDHKPAVVILVQKEPGFSTADVVEAVEQKIKELKSLLPPRSEIHKFYNQSEILNESMSGVRNEIWSGAILAILVLYFFLKRAIPTFIVSVTIPLALLAAAVLMYLSGFTLNMMTLAALTLSVGMVVDDSIIVMENIERHLESGVPPGKSVLAGTKQILGADVSGTLTTLIVFLPLLFLTGFLGQLILPFGLTIGYTLLASLIISLTVIPVLMQWRGGTKAPLKPIRLLIWFSRRNDRCFHYFMSHKKLVFGALTSVFLLAGGLTVTFNAAGFLPEIDEGALLIEYLMRPGVSLLESSHLGQRIADDLLKLDDVSNVTVKIGSPQNTYFIEDVNRGELWIKLKDRRLRHESAGDILRYLRRKFAGVQGAVFLYHQPTQEHIDESFSGLPAFFGISLFGDNLDTLSTLSRQVEKIAQNTDGLSNIINNAKFTVPEIEVMPKRPALAHAGLSVQQVMDEIAMAFQGSIISYFIQEQAPVAIFLRLPEQQRNTLATLEDLPIKTAWRSYLPLQQLATIRYRNVLPAITHMNSQRQITLVSEIEGNLYGIVQDLKAKLDRLHFPAGYYYEIRGQYQILLQSVKEFAAVIIAAIALVYLILYLQFNSFWQPFVILLKVPLDFLGAFVALLLTGETLNLSVAIGLVTLVGIAVNNAIVLIDTTNRLREAHQLSRQAALLEAVHVRTRPILMTGMTTVFGLLPAAIGMGIGSRIHQPFAITLIGGILAGVFFSLNVIPALYDRMGQWLERPPG